jgi:D-ribulokinase
LNEAGQSAAGAAIDHLVSFHPAAAQATKEADAAGIGLAAYLSSKVANPAQSSDVALLANGLHVVPEFLGNRAPFADPDARAIIAGLDMDTSVDSLVRLYVAGICGLGYGLRQIIDAQKEHGVEVATIVVSGGAGQSEMVRQLLADATGMEVAAPLTEEPVLLGSAMLGATAAGHFSDLTAAMTAMSAMGNTYTPADGDVRLCHAKRYEAFKLLQSVGRTLNS